MGEESENRLAAGAHAAVVRASDGDREAVAARLNEAVGDGRLTLQEFSERLDLAYTARTARRPGAAHRRPAGDRSGARTGEAAQSDARHLLGLTPGRAAAPGG